jgi:hypothetical protein
MSMNLLLFVISLREKERKRERESSDLACHRQKMMIEVVMKYRLYLSAQPLESYINGVIGLNFLPLSLAN